MNQNNSILICLKGNITVMNNGFIKPHGNGFKAMNKILGIEIFDNYEDAFLFIGKASQ